VEARTETLRQDLAHAMRTGPFSAVLNLAFESSGVSLERAQEQLAARGVHVSLSALSYWRRGRSRPERPASLRAVAHLEEILGLPERALTAQLGPRRRRGRWLDHAPDRIDPATGWDRHEIDSLIDEVETPVHNGIVRISVHDLYVVGSRREEVSLTTRQILRAETDQVSRMTIMYRMYRDLASPPQLKAIRGCRLGRVRIDLAAGFIAAEILFDRVLRLGDTAVVEYEVRGLFPDEETDFFHRLMLGPTMEYVLQIEFDPAAIPARCWRYERRRETAPDQGVREIWVGGTGLAHVAAFNIPPGVIGARWEWA
jgi:hypothetical protein